MKPTRMPTVIIPYKWPVTEPSHEDVFVYLRPETNGVRVESLLLRTIRDKPRYRDNITIAYLANVPGDFIAQNRIVEEHYADRIYFTLNGRAAFTPDMRRRFETFFQESFDKAEILGAFEAIRRNGWSSDHLFELRVEAEDVCVINGQSVKRIQGQYVINYDMPAILRKNHARTDIAVMILRSNLESEEFQQLLHDIRANLVEGEVLSAATPLSHALHHSKSPFEQILDAKGYLYQPDGSHCQFETVRFTDWLLRSGVDLNVIRGLLRFPILVFRDPESGIVEEHLFVYTEGDSYGTAQQKLDRVVAQVLIG